MNLSNTSASNAHLRITEQHKLSEISQVKMGRFTKNISRVNNSHICIRGVQEKIDQPKTENKNASISDSLKKVSAGVVDSRNQYRTNGNDSTTAKNVNGLISPAQLEQITSNILKRNPSSIDDVKNALNYIALTTGEVNSIISYIQRLPQFSDKKNEITESKSTEPENVFFSFHEQTEFDKNALAYIANPKNFSHTFKDDGSILSTSKKHPENSKFLNSFSKEKWKFISNFRQGDEGKSKEPYFANHIAQYQYALSSEKFNFSGALPKQIIRVDVLNQETLNDTYGLSDDQLFNVFFNRTPNGKSTKRILESFGLEAYSVIKTVEHGEHVNFNIRVRALSH